MGENKPRIVQIRRGTTAEHENFKGKIGEVTMDTDAKTLRIHDGQTPGGITLARRDEIPESVSLPEGYDFVIEASATATLWYRKYQSGWVEQGGQFAVSVGNNSIALPVAMANSDYFAQASNYSGNQSNITIKVMNTSNLENVVIYSSANSGVFWEVKGWAAK